MLNFQSGAYCNIKRRHFDLTMRRVLRFWLCAFVPCQEWLRTTASSVSQALQVATRASTKDRHHNQILHIFAELCAVFAKNEIPYGI